MTPIERRVLAYLDQRGGRAHRRDVVTDLAHPDSRTGWRRDRNSYTGGGSNGAAPLIMGHWCKGLVARGLVRLVTRDGFYDAHEITTAGRKALREEQPA